MVQGDHGGQRLWFVDCHYLPNFSRAVENWAEIAEQLGNIVELKKLFQQNVVADYHGHPVQRISRIKTISLGFYPSSPLYQFQVIHRWTDERMFFPGISRRRRRPASRAARAAARRPWSTCAGSSRWPPTWSPETENDGWHTGNFICWRTWVGLRVEFDLGYSTILLGQ